MAPTPMSDWILSRRFAFEGQDVRYEIFGEGPPLVLVHGTPWSSFNWRHLIPALSQHWSVHVYDLLGYGQSEMASAGADQDVSLEVQGRLLAALLKHWKLEAPRVIAHDFGGSATLRAHLLHGCDFKQIVLVDPVALKPWGSPFFAHVQKHEAAFQGVPDYIHEAIIRAYVQGATHAAMPDDTLAGILKPWRGERGRHAFYRQIAQADQRYTDDLEPLYARIARPVLIAWGEADRWIPVETGRRLHAAIPGSRFTAIANAGHLVQEDQPQALLGAVENFFR